MIIISLFQIFIYIATISGISQLLLVYKIIFYLKSSIPMNWPKAVKKFKYSQLYKINKYNLACVLYVLNTFPAACARCVTRIISRIIIVQNVLTFVESKCFVLCTSQHELEAVDAEQRLRNQRLCHSFQMLKKIVRYNNYVRDLRF